MIKAQRAIIGNLLLDVWCDEEDIDAIFALEGVAAMTPVNIQYEKKKSRWFHVLVDGRYNPDDIVRQIEALDVQVPASFTDAFND